MSNIDWSQAPEWAQYAAMDFDCGWYWYAVTPYTASYSWISDGRQEKFTNKQQNVEDWEKSLTERQIENMFTETKTTKTTTEKKSPFVFEEGGPIHPVAYGNIHDGISLRDYFAAKTMQAMIYEESYATFATKAYELADAMLEARTKQPE